MSIAMKAANQARSMAVVRDSNHEWTRMDTNFGNDESGGNGLQLFSLVIPSAFVIELRHCAIIVPAESLRPFLAAA